jgi:hypothetical protein
MRREGLRLRGLAEAASGRISGTRLAADGGLPVGDLSKAIPDEDRDRVLGEMLLET